MEFPSGLFSCHAVDGRNLAPSCTSQEVVYQIMRFQSFAHPCWFAIFSIDQLVFAGFSAIGRKWWHVRLWGPNHFKIHKAHIDMIHKQCVLGCIWRVRCLNLTQTQIHSSVFQCFKQAFFRGIGSEVSSVRTCTDRTQAPVHRYVRTGTKLTWNKHTTKRNIFGFLNDVTFDFSGSLVHEYHWLNK